MHEGALDKKTEAALLLARGKSTDAAGATVGVDGSTVRRWRQDPDFKTEVTRLRGELLSQTVGSLVDAATDAVSTLREALGAESPAIRVRAAVAILSAMISTREAADVEERLAALEAAAAEREAL